MNEWMNHRGDCKAALAAPGLLIIWSKWTFLIRFFWRPGTIWMANQNAKVYWSTQEKKPIYYIFFQFFCQSGKFYYIIYTGKRYLLHFSFYMAPFHFLIHRATKQQCLWFNFVHEISILNMPIGFAWLK